MARPELFELSEWALFLDLDGTLLDIAASPEAVVVPQSLIDTLRALRNQLCGALAIISGRQIGTVDRLLHPLQIPTAGEHGAALRFPDGNITEAGSRTVVPEDWRQAIRLQANGWRNIVVEEKAHSVAVHYRGNPPARSEIELFLNALVQRNCSFQVLPAAMAFELRHNSVNKGNALAALMAQAPFRNRKPLFVGDDVTDEDAILAASQLGGRGFRVSEDFSGEPAQVRLWLGHLVEQADRRLIQMSFRSLSG
ncbi:MAG: trehalose-phosphatase [Proteobacteria bacterium]|nr:trehalose-phosphatase [Pseudomonadota bacterium]